MKVPDPIPRPLDHLTLRGAPEAPALVTREGMLDYAGLEQAVGALAAALRARDLGEGDRVASWLPKTRLTSLLPLACARAGLIHVPINPLLKHAQVAHILADSGARALLTAKARIATLEEGDVPAGCDLIDEEASAALFDTPPLLPSDRDPEDLAALLYTSGSTGRPKGVMLTHANLWLGAISVAAYLGLAPEDRTLAVLPLSFDYGQNQLLSTWAAGGCVVPLDYLAARDVIRAIETHKISTLAGVPPLWVQLVEAPWPATAALSLRRLTNSGGKLAPSVIRRMREVFPAADIYSMYGLTEAFRSTYLEPALLDEHPDSMGTAIPFAEIMVIGPDGQAAAEGELVHAGPLVAKGYWNDTARTAERFKPAPAGSIYGGTAVWSGDRVRRDAAGLLYFVGREDGMIKTSGNRVSPTEVEEAALASGLVAEAVALGVPDPRLGEAIALVVRPDRRDEEAALRAFLKRELPNFMQPGPIVWREDLPRSPNGKLDRVALKQELMG
ncbi:acyl-CoA ligase (AMP-forming), exosortase A system-associated [Sphingosinicella ginsenosidimutans]|uniref:Acyl-CoA ligase (AMP-forming), exosortase A system-associated n=1 Tax=Allosphingosinicella ginsenosidimutans TaxID=1176539 RepID=A0A5C6TWF2_9SPHN|nr:acyl-CoA ligase (AMP-forming), exosortase A system-associated [Sphingosinicella ginsenosidimutans]TXC64803.1 acyl-CoA ligase (AMP-forming), exosortase A system-associated [Sphingosinicella ginsenosidimutans]